jgi:hypothetical protein
MIPSERIARALERLVETATEPEPRIIVVDSESYFVEITQAETPKRIFQRTSIKTKDVLTKEQYEERFGKDAE